MTTPTVGRIVHVYVDPKINSGSDRAPAAITRVWSEVEGGKWMVNVRLLLDNQPNPEMEWRTSIWLHASRSAADADIAMVAARSELVDTDAQAKLIRQSGMHAFWPGRV